MADFENLSLRSFSYSFLGLGSAIERLEVFRGGKNLRTEMGMKGRSRDTERIDPATSEAICGNGRERADRSGGAAAEVAQGGSEGGKEAFPAGFKGKKSPFWIGSWAWLAKGSAWTQ
jgi:hypothetical protein